MSILFFDGFDRCTIIKNFDKNYWSFEPQQPIEYEKYAFGGYSYDHTQANYGQYYSYYSPNNATLPSGEYFDTYIYDSFGTSYRHQINSNKYPGFGSPYGFLALHNIDITDSNNLVPLTYIQLSGFNQPTTNDSFLSARFLGIETKDTAYANNDKPGRFGTKHPLLAFCSGNTTGLILNIVKVTGNHLSILEDQKMTIGLQIEQNGNISGTFDLNLSEDIQDYQIRSVYGDLKNDYSFSGFAGRILTVARNDTEKQNVADAGKAWAVGVTTDEPVPEDGDAPSICPISRWIHFGIGISHSGSDTYIQLKVEDIDVLVIPIDDTVSDKDLWNDKIYISDFNYDNIRFFNRTYNGDIEFRDYAADRVNDSSFFPLDDPHISDRYYLRGALTLLDDVVLSDASGTPNYFPGSNTKVIPFTPGINGNINNNGVFSDGLREWSTNSSSHRLALKNLDGDEGKIFTSSAGNVVAVKHSNTNLIIPDSSSAWRGRLEDAVGGIKLYSSAKKEFLDASYINVIYSGASDIYGEYVSLLLDVDNDNNIYDKTRNYSLNNGNFINNENINTTGNINKFLDSSSIQFNDSYVGLDYVSLNPGNQSNSTYRNNFPKPEYFFVIESWIYFTGDDPTYLCRKDNLLNNSTYLSKSFDIFCTRQYLQYSTYVEDEMVSYRRLYFHETIPTGEWYHIALNNDGIEESIASSTAYWNPNVLQHNHEYRLITYLNGVANTGYEVYQQSQSGSISLFPFSNNHFFSSNYIDSNLYGKAAHTFEYSTISNHDINLISDNKTSSLNNITSSYGSLTGSGIFSSPATGNFTGFGSIRYSQLTLLTFESNYDGILHIDCRLAFYGTNFLIHQNNNPIITKVTNSTMLNNIATDYYTNFSVTGNYPVNSGDTIRFSSYATTTNSSAALYIKNIYISQNGTVPGIYKLPTVSQSVGSQIACLGQYGNVGQFVDGFLEFSDTPSREVWVNDINPYPYFIGGNNIISNYRITQGTRRIPNQTVTRYNENFNTPTEAFKVIYDDYQEVGDPITLTKTRYGQPSQTYFFDNPITNQPWTTGFLGNPSGFLFGVKKL